MKTRLARLLVALIDAAYELVSPEPEPPAARVPIPTIGRIVWYHATATGQLYAACITAVDSPGDPDSACSLTLFPPLIAPKTKAHIAHGNSGDQWSWPIY